MKILLIMLAVASITTIIGINIFSIKTRKLLVDSKITYTDYLALDKKFNIGQAISFAIFILSVLFIASI